MAQEKAMEKEFQLQTKPIVSGGEASSAAEMAVDEVFFNGVYAGLNFHSLLKQDQTPPLPPFLESSLNYDPNGYPATEIQNLKIPKTEQLFFNVNSSISGEVPKYNFFSNTTPSVAEYDVIFPQLPGLLSLELPQHKHFQLAASSPSNSEEPAASATHCHSDRSYHQHRFGPYRSPGAVAPSSTLARQRRQRISDKTRCLQKLLPWDKRMDMATMLEETYKYIKFLQAQISVLQSMPSITAAVPPRSIGNEENGGVHGSVLERLNRQQLLEVVVNSPVVQTMLYSKECCVYSVEQLNMLQNIAERNGFFHLNMHGI